MAESEERDLGANPNQSDKSKYHARYENSYAIVIGIDTYHDPKLRPLGKAEEDARCMSRILSEEPYKFQVDMLLGEQATRKAITGALNKIIKISNADDRIVFYFAGHGYIVPDNRGCDVGYLACADTDPDDPFDGLKYDEVIELTHYAKAKHIAFIFDACFSGSSLGLTRSAVQTVAVQEYLLHSAYQVLTAGGTEVVSDARSMTGELVKILQEGIPGRSDPFTFSHLGQCIHDVVHNQSKGRQSPIYGFLEGSSKGQLVLVSPKMVDMLPPDLRLGLSNSDPIVRRFAIAEAEKYLDDPDLGEKVRAVLEKMQFDDDDRDVRHRASEAIHNFQEEQKLTSESQKVFVKQEQVSSKDDQVQQIPLMSDNKILQKKPQLFYLFLFMIGVAIIGTSIYLIWNNYERKSNPIVDKNSAVPTTEITHPKEIIKIVTATQNRIATATQKRIATATQESIAIATQEIVTAEINKPVVNFFSEGCIHQVAWEPYSMENTTSSGGCLELSEWGFTALDNGLLVTVQSPPREMQQGFYTPIKEAAKIRLNLRIKQLYTPTADNLANLSIGFVPINQMGTPADGRLFYQLESPDFPIFIKGRERGGYDAYIKINDGYLKYEEDTLQEVNFEITSGNLLKIYVDQNLVFGPVTLPYKNIGFWIGYRVPKNGQLQAEINNLELIY